MDIQNREDIIKVIDYFYKDVNEDPLLSPIFNQTMMINWQRHLPRMYDYWALQLFGTEGYTGTPFMPHININEKVTLRDPHFDQWLALFDRAVDAQFAGPNAEKLKSSAHTLREMFNYKINMINEFQKELQK